jgi:hypothetical protein
MFGSMIAAIKERDGCWSLPIFIADAASLLSVQNNTRAILGFAPGRDCQSLASELQILYGYYRLAFDSADSWKADLNALARFWDGEPPGEPRLHPARTEPRPPGIKQGRLADRPTGESSWQPK